MCSFLLISLEWDKFPKQSSLDELIIHQLAEKGGLNEYEYFRLFQARYKALAPVQYLMMQFHAVEQVIAVSLEINRLIGWRSTRMEAELIMPEMGCDLCAYSYYPN